MYDYTDHSIDFDQQNLTDTDLGKELLEAINKVCTKEKKVHVPPLFSFVVVLYLSAFNKYYRFSFLILLVNPVMQRSGLKKISKYINHNVY